MLYGLYLSATGVLTNSYRQDVIANNLANSETVGFKKDVALFQQRLTATQEQRKIAAHGDPRMLENLGGGVFASPTLVDSSQGELEPTGNQLDIAVQGNGYFAVKAGGNSRLTRDGRFMVDRAGKDQQVLDIQHRPIAIDSTQPLSIGKDGVITQAGKPVAQVGLFDVPDKTKLQKEPGNLLNAGEMPLRPATGTLRSEFVERSNVDPTTELAQLMDAQRQLEANANMIRYQDQMLGKLVNEVGKIS